MRKGSCLCGAVTLKLSGEPIRSLMCFCKDCQKMTGSDRLMALWVPGDKLQVESGELQSTVRHGDSGGVLRNHYCKKCLTRVYGMAEATGVAVVPTSLMDDLSELAPTMAIYTSSAQPWTEVPEGIKCYEKMPQRSK